MPMLTDAPFCFSREMRSIIYQRSKGLPDTRALGTKRDVYSEGHEWAGHSLWPVHVAAWVCELGVRVVARGLFARFPSQPRRLRPKSRTNALPPRTRVLSLG